MSGLAASIRKSIEEYVSAKPLLLKVWNFLYNALLWNNFITFAIVAALVLVDYVFVVSSEWRVLAYIFILILEVYLVVFLLSTVTPFLKSTEEEGQASLTSTLDYVFNKLAECGTCENCKNPLNEIEALKKFQQTPYYIPTLVTVVLLVLALVSAIFPGSFLAFILVFGLLLAPGIISHNYHILAKEKVWDPIILPQLKNLYAKVEPQINQLLAKVKGQKGGASGEAPPASVEPTTRDYAPPVEQEPPAEAPVDTPADVQPTEEGGEEQQGGLDVNSLLNSIGTLAQSLDDS